MIRVIDGYDAEFEKKNEHDSQNSTNEFHLVIIATYSPINIENCRSLWVIVDR